jgi:hypothetical protein
MNCVYDENGKYFVISDRLISFNPFTYSTNPCICFDYGTHGEHTAVFESSEYRDSVLKTVINIIRNQL